MRSTVGSTLITVGAGVGMVGALVYVSGIQVHLSPALVSLLLAKATFAAAGGLMVAGAVLRRRALQRSQEDQGRLDRTSVPVLAVGGDDSIQGAAATSRPAVRQDDDSGKTIRRIDRE
ncbi:MAG: hypothetical protein ACR2OG_15865 [Gemmatimonadaceae bacterium]